MTELRKLIIDGTEIEVDPRMTLLQACEAAGVRCVLVGAGAEEEDPLVFLHGVLKGEGVE